MTVSDQIAILYTLPLASGVIVPGCENVDATERLIVASGGYRARPSLGGMSDVRPNTAAAITNHRTSRDTGRRACCAYLFDPQGESPS